MRFVGWSFGFVFVSDYTWLCAGLRLVVFRVAPNCDGLFVSAFFFTCCVCFYFFLFYFFLFSLFFASPFLRFHTCLVCMFARTYPHRFYFFAFVVLFLLFCFSFLFMRFDLMWLFSFVVFFIVLLTLCFVFFVFAFWFSFGCFGSFCF